MIFFEFSPAAVLFICFVFFIDASLMTLVHAAMEDVDRLDVRQDSSRLHPHSTSAVGIPIQLKLHVTLNELAD